jgi:uncharacterized protein (DUF1501 family)
MPTVAQTRRDFLKVVGTAGALSLGTPLPSLWTRCFAREAKPSAQDRVLVLIQLAGGNDGLNTVVPISDDAYYRARPGLAIAKGSALPLNDRLGLHPSLEAFRKLWDANRLAIVEGVGYPQPDRSHFRSMDIWHSAQPQEQYPQTGWIGRSLDWLADKPHDPREAACIGLNKQPLACIGAKVIPPTIQRLEEFRLLHRPTHDRGIDHTAWNAAVQVPSADLAGDLAFLRKSAAATVASARRLETLSDYRPAVDYPGTGLGQRLRLIAQMIAADLPTRVFFVSLDGFDTHSQQLPGHAALLRELADAVFAFLEDIAEQGAMERVLVATFSEFGRRVAENGSLGTDHGAASVLFVATPPGHGGCYGSPPSLTDLDDGDPKFTTDFRQVYATFLDRWLEIPSQPILGGDYRPVPFV